MLFWWAYPVRSFRIKRFTFSFWRIFILTNYFYLQKGLLHRCSIRHRFYRSKFYFSILGLYLFYQMFTFLIDYVLFWGTSFVSKFCRRLVLLDMKYLSSWAQHLVKLGGNDCLFCMFLVMFVAQIFSRFIIRSEIKQKEVN